MRTNLPKRCRKHECGIINLDNEEGPGTHWVGYYKKDNSTCYYFDSFGDLQSLRSLSPMLAVINVKFCTITSDNKRSIPSFAVIYV